MSLVRLYGRTLGHSSHARVTAGFASVLEAAGLLEVIYPLDRAELPDDDPIPGAQAPVAIFTGPLGLLDRMVTNTRHKWRYAMVAPNSDKVPPQLLKKLGEVCTDVLVPSRWAKRVMLEESMRSGITFRHALETMRSGSSDLSYWNEPYQDAITVVPHGVGPEFMVYAEMRAAARELYREQHFRVLHLSTSELQRKGTTLLMEAWQRARSQLPQHAELVLVLDPMAYQRAVEWQLDAGVLDPSIKLYPRANLSPRAMALSLSWAHVVCQPSRGEAFGLCPLEARACGVPIIVTAVTGHTEWLPKGVDVGQRIGDSRGVVIVPHGAMEPIDDLPGAEAPSVAVRDIADALVRAYDCWEDLATEAEIVAPLVQTGWAWERKLEPFVNMLRTHVQKALAR